MRKKLIKMERWLRQMKDKRGLQDGSQGENLLETKLLTRFNSREDWRSLRLALAKSKQ